MSGIALGIGTGLMAFSSMRQGEVQSRAYAMEAKAKKAQSAQVESAAIREIDLTTRRAERVKQGQLASIGASGVQLQGSPLAQVEEAAALAFDEIQAIRAAADYRRSTLDFEGMLSERLGEEALISGYLQGAGSILTGVGKNPYLYDKKVVSGVSSGGGSGSSLLMS